MEDVIKKTEEVHFHPQQYHRQHPHQYHRQHPHQLIIQDYCTAIAT